MIIRSTYGRIPTQHLVPSDKRTVRTIGLCQDPSTRRRTRYRVTGPTASGNVPSTTTGGNSSRPNNYHLRLSCASHYLPSCHRTSVFRLGCKRRLYYCLFFFFFPSATNVQSFACSVFTHDLDFLNNNVAPTFPNKDTQPNASILHLAFYSYHAPTLTAACPSFARK